MTWLTAYLEEFTYIGIALSLFVAGLGVPIPEDIPLIFGGAMAGAGKINVWIHFAISMAFILIGDSCLYWIGRKVGRASAGGGLVGKVLTAERREKVTSYYERFGSWTVFFGRFVAGLRGAIFLTAGVVNFPFWRFVVLDTLAAIVSVPVWIWLGYTFGENWELILEKAKSMQGWVLAAIAVAAVGGYVLVKLWKRQRRKTNEAYASAEAAEQKHLQQDRGEGEQAGAEARAVRRAHAGEQQEHQVDVLDVDAEHR